MEIKTIIIKGKTRIVTREQLDRIIEAGLEHKIIERRSVS